jgi:hypothetical protein
LHILTIHYLLFSGGAVNPWTYGTVPKKLERITLTQFHHTDSIKFVLEQEAPVSIAIGRHAQIPTKMTYSESFR